MHQIIYMSYAVTPLSTAQLCQLLTLSRSHNAASAITGILLYGNERFVQVLEGQELTVRTLYERIKSDARHRHVTAYADRPITKRTFTQWAMAFQANSAEQAEILVGYLGTAEVAVDVLSILSIDTKLVTVLRDFTLP